MNISLQKKKTRLSLMTKPFRPVFQPWTRQTTSGLHFHPTPLSSPGSKTHNPSGGYPTDRGIFCRFYQDAYKKKSLNLSQPEVWPKLVACNIGYG